MRVSVAIALKDRQEVIELELAPGATVEDAVSAAGIAARFPEVDLAAARYGIWSRAVAVTARLREGDRVEVYRPLNADPKDARRARVRTSTRSRSGP
jgi:putative ubiquitin-RnfH superfamily antitoxin RatB of RatAB toxin-antitoxin module